MRAILRRRNGGRPRWAIALAFVASWVFACREAPTVPDAAPIDPAAVVVVHAAPSSDAATAELPKVAYAELVRRGQWGAAKAALDALAAPERDAAELRYLRSRIAAKLGQPADAVKLLEGLESKLPLLAANIRAARAEAELAVGPYLDAGLYYASLDQSAALVKAARAFELGGDPERARRAADRVVALAKHARTEEATARAIRLHLVAGAATANDKLDAKWIALNAPDLPEAKEAEEFLNAHGGLILTQQEWLIRARALASARMSDEALRSIERAVSGGGRPVAPVDFCHARAEAYFKAKTRYAEAAVTYARCAQQAAGDDALEDRFLEGRSLARADRDDEAIVVFQRLFDQHRTSRWAQEGLFHAGRLHFLHGRPAKAAELLDRYMDAFPKGKENREAQRYRALAHYWNKNLRKARQAFEQLASDPDTDTALRATNLAALAAFDDGDVLFAKARWKTVLRTRPLSYAAVVARARLHAAGEDVPYIDLPPTDDIAPLVVALPDAVALLHRLGLDGEAERALIDREGIVTQQARGRETEALCEAYGMLGRGERRFQLSASIPGTAFERAPGAKNAWAWRCAYPTPFLEIAEASLAKEADGKAKKEAIDLFTVYGVMRTESAFQEPVVSPARAVGLMQLLPETAQAVAKGKTEAKSATPKEIDLTDGATNVPLGVAYLNELDAATKHTLPLTVAAYNAGPEAVLSWGKRLDKLPMDAWVEAIPYVETRNYVSRVVGARAKYAYLRGGAEALGAFPLDVPKL